MDIFLAGVLFAVPGSVARGSEFVCAGECFGVGAGVFLLGDGGFVVGGRIRAIRGCDGDAGVGFDGG